MSRPFKVIIVLLFILTALFIAGVYGFNIYLNSQAVKQPEVAVVAPSIESAVGSYDKGDLDLAIDTSQKLLAENDRDALALLTLATTYAQKGSVTFNETTYAAKAIETANKVLALNLENDVLNSEAYRIIGYANEIMNKFDEARKNYDLAIKLNSKNSQAYSNKGHSYDLQGDLKNADLWYDKALAIDGGNEHALINKVRVLLRQGKFEEARKIALQTTERAKTSHIKAEAYLTLAIIEMYGSNEPVFDVSKSLEYVNRSLALDSRLPQSWVLKGRIELVKTGEIADRNAYLAKLKEIKINASKALSINPNQSSAYSLLADIASLEGDENAVKDLNDKLRKVIPLDITLTQAEKDDLLSTLDMEINVKSSK